MKSTVCSWFKTGRDRAFLTRRPCPRLLLSKSQKTCTRNNVARMLAGLLLSRGKAALNFIYGGSDGCEIVKNTYVVPNV